MKTERTENENEKDTKDEDTKEWIRIVRAEVTEGRKPFIEIQCMRCLKKEKVQNEEERDFGEIVRDIMEMKNKHRKCGADMVVKRFIEDQWKLGGRK